MRKTVIAAPTLLAAAAATLAGCAGPDDTAAASGPDTEPARFSHGPLVGPTGDGEIGIVNRESRPNRPYPYGSLYVCVTGSEPVTIDSMAAEQTVGGVSVSRFGVASKRGASFSLVPLRPLSDRYAPAEGYQLEPGCADGRRYDVGVELVRTTAGDAAVEGIRVTYEVAGQSRTDTWPVTIVLCDPNRGGAHPDCE